MLVEEPASVPSAGLLVDVTIRFPEERVLNPPEPSATGGIPGRKSSTETSGVGGSGRETEIKHLTNVSHSSARSIWSFSCVWSGVAALFTSFPVLADAGASFCHSDSIIPFYNRLFP